MIKLVILAVVALLIAIFFIYFFGIRQSKPSVPANVVNASTSPNISGPQEVPPGLPSNIELAPEPSSSSIPQPSSNATNNAQIAALQQQIASLQSQINQLKTAPTTTTSSSSNAAPSYILALGSPISSTSQTYQPQTGLTVTVNPSDYPGYSNMQLEVNMYLTDGNGTAYAQLYNPTTGTAVTGSTVSTSVYNPTWISSQSFSLPSGSATYQLQLYSTTGYTVNVQNFRIKVNP